MKLDEVKAQIGKLHDAQCAILRAKSRWMSQGEHNTKYFFNLEKANAKAKARNKIRNEKGQLVSRYNEIIEEQV